MSAVPVNPIARWTNREAFLGKVDVRRHFLEYRLFVDVTQGRIAFEASREHVEIMEVESAKDLAKLLFVVATLDEEALRVDPAGRNTGISSEDNPVFGFGDADDFVILISVRIGGIEAKDTQPTGEFANHDIRNELGRV
jgi:hypothetical protein